MPATLCLHVPGQPAQLRVLADDTDTAVVLGRGGDATLAVAHPSMSRRHAALRHDGAAWWVEDLDSTNGVRVGGRAVARQRLTHGDWFSLGDVFCEFRHIDAAGLDALDARAQQRRQTSGLWLGRLEQAPDRDALLGGLIAAIVQLAECHRGFLLAGDLDRGLATVACCDVRADAVQARAFAGSTAAITRAMHERAPVLVNDPAALDWARGRPSIVAGRLRALVAMPILHRGELLGLAYADSDEPGKIFTELDRDILAAFASQAALLLAARGLDAALAALASCVEVDGGGVPGRTVPAPRWPLPT